MRSYLNVPSILHFQNMHIRADILRELHSVSTGARSRKTNVYLVMSGAMLFKESS